MYGLTEEDLDIQARARDVRGRADPVRGHRRAGRRRTAPRGDRGARRAGPRAGAVRHQHARRAGRRRLHHAAAGAACRSRWAGSPTRSAGSPPLPRRGCRRWPPRTRSSATCARPSRGEREECYAITEEGAGSDVAAIEATARRGRRRLPAERRQVARHLLQHRRLRVLPGQARRRAAPRRARDVPGGPAQPRGQRGAHPGLLAHDQPPPPDRRVRRRPGPGAPTWSARRATAWRSPTSGSGSSG